MQDKLMLKLFVGCQECKSSTNVKTDNEFVILVSCAHGLKLEGMESTYVHVICMYAIWYRAVEIVSLQHYHFEITRAVLYSVSTAL